MTEYEKTVSWWQNKKIATVSELSEILNEYSIVFAYHSGKLENGRITYHDTNDIFKHDIVTDYTGSLCTLFEIYDAKIAYRLFLTAFSKRCSFDEVFIKELQSCMMKNSYDEHRRKLGERSGEYKKHDFRTGRNKVGALPENVHEQMQKLLNELREVESMNILTATAYFHAKFENIHPFADGNGRTGRLAMNYFLVLHNHPPVIIYQEDRQEYYEVLEAWDLEQNLTPLYEFLKHQTVKTWKKQICRGERND